MRLFRRPGEHHGTRSEVVDGPVERRVVREPVPEASPEARERERASTVGSDDGGGEEDLLAAGELPLRQHDADHPHGDRREEVLLGRGGAAEEEGRADARAQHGQLDGRTDRRDTIEGGVVAHRDLARAPQVGQPAAEELDPTQLPQDALTVELAGRQVDLARQHVSVAVEELPG